MKNQNILLGVNIDHVATLRQARYKEYAKGYGKMVEPDPLRLAYEAEFGGCDGITIHLREDRRHIIDEDIYRIKESIQTRLNFEMAGTGAMLAIALKLEPASVCLVPERRDEVTTEGGLNLEKQGSEFVEVVQALQAAQIKVSLFIDADKKQIDQAKKFGTDDVELHTGAFANNYYDLEARQIAYKRLEASAWHAHELGLGVHAGHGINYVNISTIKHLPYLKEVNIGHSIISHALFIGMKGAVKEMKQKLKN